MVKLEEEETLPPFSIHPFRGTFMIEKVDSFMEFFYKLIKILTILACVAGLVWSCNNNGVIA